MLRQRIAERIRKHWAKVNSHKTCETEKPFDATNLDGIGRHHEGPQYIEQKAIGIGAAYLAKPGIQHDPISRQEQKAEAPQGGYFSVWLQALAPENGGIGAETQAEYAKG